jgi:murein DD-endopeptidase MepM/ murein hydrolase activator NlpD
MERLKLHPKSRRTVSDRTRRLISYAWIVASLMLPALGVMLISPGLLAVPPSASDVTHEVRAGETLTAIAMRYGVSVDEIARANGLADPNRIYVGQVLVIPRRDTASGDQVHVVQVGETLSAIARRYNTTVDAIVSANGLANRDSIFAGQQLLIPGTQTVSGPAAAPSTARSVSYTLQRGDSLYRVSLIFGVSVDDILAANNLASPNAVYPGLEIRIPPPRETTSPVEVAAGPPGESTGGRTYTVQRGDTLSRIALTYNVTVDGLVAANGLTRPDRIYPGQVLNIPEGGAAARPYPAQTAVSHTVRPGETLSAIALRYGVTVHMLAVANGISNPSQIYAGMVLSIPSAQAGSNSVRYASVGSGLCSGVEPTQAGTGYFIRPVRGYVITQRFHVWHSGIDLAVGTGSSVFAADGGTVVYAGWNPVGYGNLIVLDHGNGWRTYYAHLSEVDVTCGEWIPRGSIIGRVGSTGNSTGPHLHFEILRFGVSVNPEGYIRF